ncbi:hypothetical protein D3C74_262910 [compost metagenome]
MSKVSFKDSFRPKGSFERLISNKFEGSFVSESNKKGRFKNEVSGITPEISFFSNDVKKSKNLTENKFTNFLSNSTEQLIKTCIYDIFDNPNIIDTPNADAVRFTDPKILNCLKLYHATVSEECLIIKSNLIDEVGLPKPVRVFSIVEMQHTPEPKATSKILLIDPFHLVIPSEHGGQAKRVVEEQTFLKNKDNRICMNNYVKEIRGF